MNPQEVSNNRLRSASIQSEFLPLKSSSYICMKMLTEVTSHFFQVLFS